MKMKNIFALLLCLLCEWKSFLFSGLVLLDWFINIDRFHRPIRERFYAVLCIVSATILQMIFCTENKKQNTNFGDHPNKLFNSLGSFSFSLSIAIDEFECDCGSGSSSVFCFPCGVWLLWWWFGWICFVLK